MSALLTIKNRFSTTPLRMLYGVRISNDFIAFHFISQLKYLIGLGEDTIHHYACQSMFVFYSQFQMKPKYT